MDYEGQRLSELLFYWIILAFGIVGWIIGFFKEDFMICAIAVAIGTTISVVVSVIGT
jgi:signal peptidase complex subunit 1